MRQGNEDIVGYVVSTLDLQELLSDVGEWIRQEREGRKEVLCRWLACLNPHSYVVARRDKVFSEALNSADWVVPDGIGVVLASKILGGRIRKRITGSDIFQGVHERLNRIGGASVFILGSSEETLAMIRARMAVDFPYVCVAGTYSPPFKPVFSEEDTAQMLAAIDAAAPDVLWVGMTAPKQEIWIYENLYRLPVKFAAAVGAVLDFYSGRVKRSSPAFQAIGLEWLPRLTREPGRLWRRTFVSAPIFLCHVIRARWSNDTG